MKLDGKALAQAMLRRKENETVKSEAEVDAPVNQLETGSHIAEMSSLYECMGKGDHEKAHQHLVNLVRSIQSKKD